MKRAQSTTLKIQVKCNLWIIAQCQLNVNGLHTHMGKSKHYVLVCSSVSLIAISSPYWHNSSMCGKIAAFKKCDINCCRSPSVYERTIYSWQYQAQSLKHCYYLIAYCIDMSVSHQISLFDSTLKRGRLHLRIATVCCVHVHKFRNLPAMFVEVESKKGYYLFNHSLIQECSVFASVFSFVTTF